MIDDSDYGTDDRVRYSNEMNLEFWGLQFSRSPSQLQWVGGMNLALKDAMISLSGAALGLACAVGTLSF